MGKDQDHPRQKWKVLDPNRGRGARKGSQVIHSKVGNLAPSQAALIAMDSLQMEMTNSQIVVLTLMHSTYNSDSMSQPHPIQAMDKVVECSSVLTTSTEVFLH